MKAADIEGFDDLLEQAEDLAKNPWETCFCADIRKRYDEWEDDLLVSDKQLETLNRIARTKE